MKREKDILFTIVSSGVAKRIEPAKRLQEEGQQRIAANVIDNDSGLSVVAGRHVVYDSRKFYGERAGHGKMQLQKIQDSSQDLILFLSRGSTQVTTWTCSAKLAYVDRCAVLTLWLMK